MSFTAIDTAPIFEIGDTSFASYASTFRLSANKFVYIYHVNTNDNLIADIRARVCTINNDEITVHSETVLYTETRGAVINRVTLFGAEVINDSNVAILIRIIYADLIDLSDRLEDLLLIPCYLDGSGFSMLGGNPEIVTENLNAHNVLGSGSSNITKLDDSTGAFVYYNNDGTANPKDFVLCGFTISGNTASITAQTTFDTGGATSSHSALEITALTSTVVVFGWHHRDSGSVDYNKYLGVVATYTGASFSFGSIQELGVANGAVPPAYLQKQNNTHFILFRTDSVISFVNSGGTLTGGTPEPLDPLTTGGVTGFYPLSRQFILIEDDSILLFYHDNDQVIRAAWLTFSGTTITRTGAPLFNHDYVVYDVLDFDVYPNAALGENWNGVAPILMGGNQLVIGLVADKDFNPGDPNYDPGFWDFGGVLLLETTLFDVFNTDLRLIGVSVAGSTAYVTAWAGGELLLNVISLGLGSQIDSISLGFASLAQVLNKTYIAYPCVVSGGLYIYGRINNGSTINHILFTDDGGSTFTVVENSWGADYAGAMVCESEGHFFVVRCNADQSRLYQSAGGSIGIKSTLPFAGPVEPHGLRLSPWDESLLAAVNDDGHAQTVIFSYPPYLIWQDMTTNHPQTAVNAIAPL